MSNKRFCEALVAFLPYIPTQNQLETLDVLAEFIDSPYDNSIFLLKGFAGTGKTSLIGCFVQYCIQQRIKVVLLAPTGRAAKVFSSYAHYPAFTIHKKIYRQNRYDGSSSSVFSLNNNAHKDTLFLVDEASMIANSSDSFLGSGGLLSDLVEYVYAADNCRLILIGDEAQLPPVGEKLGTALNKDFIRSMGLTLFSITMSEVARQESESGILANATLIRRLIGNDGDFVLPQLLATGFADVCAVGGEEMIDALEHCYSRDGVAETIVVTRSNKRALQFNLGVRNRILYREELLCSGDQLMVTKNNYFWTNLSSESSSVAFLANGEMLEVLRVRRGETLYGFNFVNLTVLIQSLDVEMDVKVIADSLLSESPALSSTDQNRLYEQVMADYEEIPSKAARYKKLKENDHFNAVQVKYGYAITCHKAQGGQWKNVFVDMGGIAPDHLDDTFHKWLYTAVTRATERLYFINLPPQMGGVTT